MLPYACDLHCQLPCSLGKCWPAMDTYVHLRMHVGGTDEQMPTAHPSAELASSCDIVEQYARILYVAFVFLVTEMF